MVKGAVFGTVLGVLVLFGAIQLIPYGRDHTNPPVVAEPQWSSPQTRDLAVRACYDCHSNQTVWPWYTNVAPFSWLIQSDVNRGRRRLNFSDWTGRGGGEMARTVGRGSMPPWYYVLIHPSANLSPAETQALIQGLNATFGTSGGGGEGE